MLFQLGKNNLQTLLCGRLVDSKRHKWSCSQYYDWQTEETVLKDKKFNTHENMNFLEQRKFPKIFLTSENVM